MVSMCETIVCVDNWGSGDLRFSMQNVRPQAEPEFRPTTGTVLIVDDDPLVPKVASHILKDAGYRVLEAEDGESGIRMYRERAHEIDLVLLDYVMPGIDGVETMRRIVEIDSTVRVLTSSGHCSKNDVAAFLRLGARGFLPKPYTRDTFLGTVRRALDPLS